MDHSVVCSVIMCTITVLMSKMHANGNITFTLLQSQNTTIICSSRIAGRVTDVDPYTDNIVASSLFTQILHWLTYDHHACKQVYWQLLDGPFLTVTLVSFSYDLDIDESKQFVMYGYHCAQREHALVLSFIVYAITVLMNKMHVDMHISLIAMFCPKYILICCLCGFGI